MSGSLVLQITTSKSAHRAIEYLGEHLQPGAYLQKDAVAPIAWEGKAAEQLGLADKEVDLASFSALAFNVDPTRMDEDFGERVKAAKKRPQKLDLDKVRSGTRVWVPYRGHGRIVEIDGWMGDVRLEQGGGKEVVSIELDKLREPKQTVAVREHERLTPRARQIAGWDLTFSAPKGVSLVWALTGDARIERAFNKAVERTMEDVEGLAQTRVRVGSGDNQMDDQRDTGNLLWARFTHDSSRPVEHPDGQVTVDPHLHQHVFVHNVTYDSVEGRWKAMKERAIRERASALEQTFEADFARFLQAEGIRVDKRGKYWDIVAISPEVAAKYSLRTKQVEELKKKLGITSGKAVGELGAKSRSSKSIGKDIDLREHIRERHPEDDVLCRGLPQVWDELKKSAPLDGLPPPEVRARYANEAVDYALAKVFERRSAVYRHLIFADAMRHGGGGRCAKEDIEQALSAREGLILGNPDKTHRVLVTTTEIVEQEVNLRGLVRDLREAHGPLLEHHRADQTLNGQQRAAVAGILSSRDGVIAMRGKAGTGKSRLLTSLVAELERNQITPVALAPTVAASRGSLRKDGLHDANTLAMFSEQLRGGASSAGSGEGRLGHSGRGWSCFDARDAPLHAQSGGA